jgi:16S rRNA processing protein RimM
LKKADLVAVGKIVRSQGRDGRVKLRLREKGQTGFTGARLFLKRREELEAMEVESVTLDRNSCVVKFKGIDALAAADSLAGHDVFAEEADFRSLGGDRYYDFQVLGSRVVTRAGAVIGEVAAVLDARGAVVLVVRRGHAEIYVPFTEAICVKVDPEAREILIDPPDGLLELNEI